MRFNPDSESNHDSLMLLSPTRKLFCPLCKLVMDGFSKEFTLDKQLRQQAKRFETGYVARYVLVTLSCWRLNFTLGEFVASGANLCVADLINSISCVGYNRE